MRPIPATQPRTGPAGIAFHSQVRNNAAPDYTDGDQLTIMPAQRIAIGLNSGTSADGVDAVACKLTGQGAAMRVKVLGHISPAYPTALRKRILAVMAPAQTRTEEICRLEVEIGRAFANAASALVHRLQLKRVDLIGSHGQTVCHLPPTTGKKKKSSGHVPATMQIGDPTIIAEKLRCPVVHHFRQADMAVGGQGAPLVPWTDYVLFRDKRKSRVIQNIGGIANLTYLPAGGAVEDVTAFDTGPGNLLIDSMTRTATKGRVQFDRGGRRAAKGRVHPKVLHHLMQHPFLSAAPPKSCGREQFGETYADDLRQRFASLRLYANDWIATATHFSAACMILGYAWLCDSRRTEYPPMDEVILCGGGAKNATLVRALADCLHVAGRRIPVTQMDALGISTQAKEGVSFAMLAAARIDGVPANLPRVTGAKRPVLLGDICDLGLK